MRAAILDNAPGDLDVVEVEIDDPAPDEVLIRTHACGLCHSDLHVMDATLPVPLPSVLGHEAAGVVESVGSDVTGFSVGDHVVTCLSAFCGTCRECLTGRTYVCENRRSFGNRLDGTPRLTRSGRHVNQLTGLGGFAEQMLVHHSSIVAVSREVPLDRAALLGCAVVTGVGSVFNAARVEPGSTVAVIGCGGIGLNIVQGAVLAGASRVIAVDLHPEKLTMATEFGATDVVKAGDQDPVAAVVELTSGGVDHSFEAIGLPITATQAVMMLRPGRTAYLVGVPPFDSSIELPGALISLQGRGLQGVIMGSNRFKRDIPMLADLYLQGRLKLDELVTARIPLDAVNEGYARMRRGMEARSVIVF